MAEKKVLGGTRNAKGRLGSHFEEDVPCPKCGAIIPALQTGCSICGASVFGFEDPDAAASAVPAPAAGPKKFTIPKKN